MPLKTYYRFRKDRTKWPLIYAYKLKSKTVPAEWMSVFYAGMIFWLQLSVPNMVLLSMNQKFGQYQFKIRTRGGTGDNHSCSNCEHRTRQSATVPNSHPSTSPVQPMIGDDDDDDDPIDRPPDWSPPRTCPDEIPTDVNRRQTVVVEEGSDDEPATKKPRTSRNNQGWMDLTDDTIRLLEREKITVDQLFDLTVDHLLELKVCMGDRLRILKYQEMLGKGKETLAASSSTNVSKSEPGYSNKIPSKLPKYDPKSTQFTAKDYLDRLELILSAENYNPKKWHLALAMAIRGTGTQWASRILLSDASMDWIKAKELFLKQFTWADEEREQWRRYTTLEQQDRESVREYAERFLYLSDKLHRSHDDTGTLFHFCRGLKEPLRTSYMTAEVSLRPASLTEAIEIAIKLDSRSSDEAANQLFDKRQKGKKHHPSKKKEVQKFKWEYHGTIRYQHNGCPNHPQILPGAKSFHALRDCRSQKEHDKDKLPKDARSDKKNVSGLRC